MAVTPKKSTNSSGAPNVTPKLDSRSSNDVVWPDPSPLRDWWTSVMDSDQDASDESDHDVEETT